MKVVILTAGVGSRLGFGIPKCLVEVVDQQTILDAQLRAITASLSIEDVIAVVGYRKELVIDRYPSLTYIYNENFEKTNTSKSLLKALRRIRGHDVIWMNGDVWMAPEVFRRVMESDRSSVAVNTSRVADEEVKYRVNGSNVITHLSKTTTQALGEAVGINKILAQELEKLIQSLEECAPKDYFEAAIEKLVSIVDFYPVDVSGIPCIEIDFADDLRAAQHLHI